MKKTFLILASAALLFAGCAKEQVAGTEDNGNEVTVTFTTNLVSDATKAVADNDGHAAKVNHWVLEVRDAQNELFYEEERDVTAGTPEALVQTYNLKLFKNQTYSLQFWADTKGAYNTDDLTAISTIGSVANVDSRDAFSANVDYTSLVSESKDVTLTRPFAQLNIITTDLDELKGKVVPETYAKYAPTSLKVTASVPTTFNVKTQTAGTGASQTLTATASYADFLAGDPETTLFMDYIFASANEADIVAINFSSQSEKNSISYDFSNIPLQRNYRTNIKGQLMSNDSEWTVTIDPEWNTPAFDVDLLAAEDIETLQAKLDAGAREVHLLNAPEADSEILISKLYGAASTLVITVPDTDKKLTIKTKEAGTQSYPALKLVGNVEDLVINLPESSVTLDGTYGDIEASTAANTLFITKGSTFETLNVKKGKVVLYDVDLAIKTTFANNCGIELHLEDLAALKAYAAADPEKLHCLGVTAILDADIDLNNEAWTPISGYQFAFDGNGHTVSNLKLDTEAKNVGFFGTPTSAKISNLTIDGASVTGIGHVAVLAGDGLCAQIENCTVKNATVESKVKDNDDGDKAGAICGYLSAEPNAYIKNCHVENVTVKAYRDLAAIAGFANGTAPVVSGNTAKNVRVICNTDINYKNYTSVDQFDARQVVGEQIASAIVENNTCDNVTVEYSNSEGIFSLGGSKWAITSKDGFVKIGEKLALDEWHSQFTLYADIDLQGVSWTPLFGGSSADYTTTLDGNGHTISNLTISGSDDVGLFHHFAGTIKNLTVSGANVSGNKRVGVLAGQGSCFFMENVKIVNSTVTSTAYRVGALVGHCYTEGSFKNCVVDNANLSGQKFIGGITGTAGSGEAAATKFDSVTVKNTTISCSDESQKVEGSYGAFVGTYYIEPVVSGTNVAEGNSICYANSGFGQHE